MNLSLAHLLYDKPSKDLSEKDYYPFGMVMPERNFSSDNYRFGFNSEENDDEIEGSGNWQDYGMRVYNPRLGRFPSVDPLTNKFPFYSPYQFAGNKPIWALDLDGLEEVLYSDKFDKRTGLSMSLTLLNASGLKNEIESNFASPNGKANNKYDLFIATKPRTNADFEDGISFYGHGFRKHGTGAYTKTYNSITDLKSDEIQLLENQGLEINKTFSAGKTPIIIWLNEGMADEAFMNIADFTKFMNTSKNSALDIYHEATLHALQTAAGTIDSDRYGRKQHEWGYAEDYTKFKTTYDALGTSPGYLSIKSKTSIMGVAKSKIEKTASKTKNPWQ